MKRRMAEARKTPQKDGMKMEMIKNIPHQEVLALKELVQVQPGQVVSKTLAQNKHVSLTLFAFDQGEEIGTHDSEGDAFVTVLEGTGMFVIGGKEYVLHAGECVVMPSRVPHSVHAVESFKMMLTVVFPVQ